MKTFKTILISILTSFAVVLFAFNVPAHYFDLTSDKVGATITTISGTDNLSDFPTTYNANLNALNNKTIALEATTTMSGLTSASNLATVGTLTTGTWNADTITVANGGTGATSFNQFSLLFGSSTNPVYALTNLGTSGQFLRSNGAGALPSFETSAIDQAGTFNWTGLHSFSATTTMATTTLNGLNYSFPQYANGSTTIFMYDGSGQLYHSPPLDWRVASSSRLQIESNAEVTINNGGYTKKKEITINREGQLRTSFDLSDTGGNPSSYGQIYRNGVAVGTEHITASSAYTTYYDTIDVYKGDNVQLYIKNSDGGAAGQASAKNFHIYFDEWLYAVASTSAYIKVLE